MPQLMKGYVWADHKHKMVYPCTVEAKHDEIRCRVVYHPHPFDRDLDDVTFESYSEKPTLNMHPFIPQLLEFFRSQPMTHYELDVGILVNGNFNDSYRWTRSTSGYPKEKLDKKTGKTAPALHSHMVEFLLFDLPRHPAQFMGGNTLDANPYVVSRHYAIKVASSRLLMADLRMGNVDYYYAYNEEQVHDIFSRFRELGLEGAMVKSHQHKYQRARSYDWLKLKPGDEVDGVIIDITEAVSDTDDPDKGLYVGKSLGRAGSVTLRMGDGSVASPHGIGHELGKLMWEHPENYIGKQWATMKYMERDRQGGYRHPTFGRLREAK